MLREWLHFWTGKAEAKEEMDERLIVIFTRLSEDLANLEKALSSTRELLLEMSKDVKKNGKTVEKRLDTIQATQRFLANQQPRWQGTSPFRAMREENHDD